jgi:hypothetical protein
LVIAAAFCSILLFVVFVFVIIHSSVKHPLHTTFH